MIPSKSPIASFFRGVVHHPKGVLVCLLVLTVLAGFQARHFRLDASSETMVLENDGDLLYWRQMEVRYGTSDFLALTYSPHQDLLSDESLSHLTQLQAELESLDAVESVTSILNAPLLQSPPVPLKDVARNVRTLSDPNTDRQLARIEFLNSPLYRNLLVSTDFKSTALLINFPDDAHFRELRRTRNALRDQERLSGLCPTEQQALKDAQEAFRLYRDQVRHQRHQDILAIRAIVDDYRDQADLFLGGVSMITDDMMTFIRNDLKIFGIGVTLFLMLTLGLIFRALRWILLPLLVCVVSVITMIGLLGWLGWEVTVISSNFISLQLIITMAIAIHLIVRYRELTATHPEANNHELIVEVMRLKLKPCLYAMLTTVAGFASLILCDIRPVITFGWMMIIGLGISLVLTFLLFPAILVLLPRERVQIRKDWRFSLTDLLAGFTLKHGPFIVILAAVGLVLSAMGISKLEVENSFIDYFKKTTEIYQGMKVIDQQLGGTTPLDVVVTFDYNEPEQPVAMPESGLEDDELALFDEFGEADLMDEFEEDSNDAGTYWYTLSKMETARKVHAYLEQLPATGKVLSLATLLELTDKLNNDRPLDGLELALLVKEAPEDVTGLLVDPYVSIENNEMRFAARISDSDPNLRRNALIRKIQRDLVEELGLSPDNIHLSGLLILYNNMLQSLFGSQIKTLGLTLLALAIMFLILFRSVKIALIAIFPNLLSVGMVLGIMGWFRIPLDLMTITIAAISVGIAVDDTIHYIHRFKEEFKKDRDYRQTMLRCHQSIGHAMYYTSITIMIGFSILGLSNFIPSILFGPVHQPGHVDCPISGLDIIAPAVNDGASFRPN